MSIKTVIDKITTARHISSYKLAKDINMCPSALYYYVSDRYSGSYVNMIRRLYIYAKQHNIDINIDDVIDRRDKL